MSGFVRRYGFFPGKELITLLEGVIIADLPPPGSIEGVGTGVVALVGEFSNMTNAVSVSSSGVASSRPAAAEVLGSTDLFNKFGGFDEFLGKFGGDMGNGYVEIINKTFARLVCCPVDLVTPAAGTQGTIRLWRELPTNNSATDANPIVPVSPATVFSSRQFLNSSARVRLAAHVTFSDFIAYATGVDGAITNVGTPAATQTFNSAGGLFTTRTRNDGTIGVQEGDILVLGVLSGAGALGANAATYRVVSVTSATALVVELMAGTSFDWTTGTAQPWRLSMGSTADSGPNSYPGNQLSEAAGFSVLARPLDSTIATGGTLTPSVVPSAGTATSWDPLSGLTGKVHPSTALTYDADVHAVNVTTTSLVQTRYLAAIDALMSDKDPSRDINIVVAARKHSAIRTKLKTHVLTASERGLTRRAIISPAINSLTFSTILGDTGDGVGTNRTDRFDFAWPGTTTLIPAAVGFTIATSDGKTTTDGVLDVTGDTWLAAVESNLAPERNPAQASPPVPTVLAPIAGFARGTPELAQPEYTQLRAKGVVALRFDRIAGPIFQSGVTTSLTSGEKNIFRRRMADFIQDSIAQRLNQFSKQPQTIALKDSVTSECVAFLEGLLSPDNPTAQRIDAYQVDSKSGNTPALTAAGIFVVIIRVRLTPTADFIVLQSEIGESVVIRTVA